ncbi:MAG: hypothetical protein PF961_10030 [Planctomycetota bacterium]|nr:hypothetical protein [Planctomycetota bacterium]
MPTPPRPGPVPGYWASWANDAFGGEVGDNPDDYRTNALTMGFNKGKWIGAVDLSSLTDKQINEMRADELTLSIGRVLTESKDDTGDFLVAAGIGLRYSNDLGGGAIQNQWHEVIGFPRVELEYEDANTAGTAWVSSQWLWLSDVETFEDTVFSDGSRLGTSFDISALMSTEGELQADLNGNLVWAGHDGVVWAGLRQAMRGSKGLTTTAEIVGEAEQGAWFEYGFSLGAWYFQGGMQLDSSLSSGRIGWMFDRPPIHHRIGKDIFTAEVGGNLSSYGLGTVVRWQPYWMLRIDDERRASVYLDYRFGRVPETELDDASARYQQGSLGIDLVMFPPRDGFQVNPFVYSGMGWRTEEIRHEGEQPNYDETEDDGFMLQGGAGVRMTFGDKPHHGRGVQYGLSTAYDLWTSFNESTAPATDGSSDSIKLMDTRSAVSLRLLMAVGW